MKQFKGIQRTYIKRVLAISCIIPNLFKCTVAKLLIPLNETTIYRQRCKRYHLYFLHLCLCLTLLLWAQQRLHHEPWCMFTENVCVLKYNATIALWCMAFHSRAMMSAAIKVARILIWWQFSRKASSTRGGNQLRQSSPGKDNNVHSRQIWKTAIPFDNIWVMHGCNAAGAKRELNKQAKNQTNKCNNST